MRKIFVLFASIIAASCLQAQTSAGYSKYITTEGLREKLSYIAGPETEGRESGTKGQQLAAAYIQAKFQSYGLLPGASGGYQMVFPLYQDTLIDYTFRINGKKYNLNNDVVFNVQSMPSHFVHQSEVVFVGNGIQDSSRNDLEGLDLKNKWVMFLEGSSNIANASSGASDTTAFRQRMVSLARITTIAMKGAKGVLIVSKDFPRRQPMSFAGSKRKSRTPDFISYTISPAVAAVILSKPATTTFDDLKTIAKGSYKASLESYVYKRKITWPSTNVLGLLPGTDKKDEYVFITAHYDHLGIQRGATYYGADDDGSGTVSVLQLAEAFSKAKAEGHGPRRTMVFMTVSGEELGLLGSEFYTNNPLYPLAKTSADLNIDMVGRMDPRYKGDSNNYVFLIGDDRISSELTPLSDSANKQVKLDLDRRFNGSDPQRYYFRSDHYNFAKKGVPIIFYSDGEHADYHRPTDTVDKINFNLLAKRARLVFHTAWIIANKDDLLKRDIPLK
jgi:hypothetical protein